MTRSAQTRPYQIPAMNHPTNQLIHKCCSYHTNSYSPVHFFGGCSWSPSGLSIIKVVKCSSLHIFRFISFDSLNFFGIFNYSRRCSIHWDNERKWRMRVNFGSSRMISIIFIHLSAKWFTRPERVKLNATISWSSVYIVLGRNYDVLLLGSVG